MPFQSEKQRKYLWANEPEIARDWTDKYGSRVKKDTGGITRLPFFQGGYPNFFQMTPENIAEAQKMSWKDAWNLEKDYKYDSKYAGKDKTSWWGHKKQGLNSMMGNFKPNSNVGGATPLTRKLMMGAGKYIPRLLSKAALPFELLRTTPANADEASMNLEDFSQLANNNQSILPKARPRMTANWSQFDDAEARNLDSQRQMELANLVNQGGQYPTEEEDENKWNMPNWDTARNVGTGIWAAINKSVPWGWGSNALNFMGGKGNPMKMFNRNRPTPAQQRANQNYMNQQRITRDPQTGRMIGGNFAGQNAPGTSFFGSQTFPQMAQKWALKNQHRVYKTPEMQQKQQNIINQATGGRDPSQGNTVTGHGKSGMGRDPNDRMAQGGLASLWRR